MKESCNMPIGYSGVVLHAHLPYVRHPEYDYFLEEHWLFEAITETYVPINYFVSIVSNKIAGVEVPESAAAASTLCTSYAGRCTIVPGVRVTVSSP